jgi:hypothetical protein
MNLNVFLSLFVLLRDDKIKLTVSYPGRTKMIFFYITLAADFVKIFSSILLFYDVFIFYDFGEFKNERGK